MNPLQLFGLFAACSGGPPEPTAEVRVSAVPEALIAATWPVEVAPDAARARFEADPGWAALLEGRPAEAAAAFARSGDAEGRARAAAELAVLYGHAAAMAAWANLRVYGDDAQPGDPPEAACLAGRAAALLGVDGPTPGGCLRSQVAGFARDERAWLERGDAPFPTGDGGRDPEPSFRYALTDADGRSFDAVDPALLLTLAVRARDEAGEGWGRVLAAAGWLPGAPPVEVPTEPASLAWRFGGVAGTDGDWVLLATGVPGDSPAGRLVTRCGADLDCLGAEVDAYRAAVGAAMDRAAGGPRDYHRRFADRLGLGVYLGALAAAEARGDTEGAARLRLATLDYADARSPDPRVWLQVAATDARQRHTLRATELAYRALPAAPGLEYARIPLDALHVRVSRGAAPGVPLH